MSEPRDKLKIIGLSISGFVVLVMLIAWFLIWRGSQDIEPPEVSDLQVEVEVVTVAPEDNALTYVDQAISALMWDKSLVSNEDPDAVDLDGWVRGEVEIDADVLAETMEENQAVFDALKRAADCGQFVTPKVLLSEPVGWNMSGLMGLRNLVVAKARWQAESGSPEEAADTLIANYRLALLVQRSGASLIQLLVGNALTYSYTEEMLALARRPETPKAVIQKMLETIPESSTVDEVFSRAMKSEYLGISEYIDHCLSSEKGREGLVHMASILDLPDELEFLSGIFFTYRFHPNRTKLLFADYYRSYVFERPETYLEAVKVGFLEGDDGELGWQDALKPNALGTSMVQDSALSLGPFLFDKLCTIKYQLGANRLALAAFAYQKDHGTLPSSLAELEGRYLPEIPRDPYNGARIRYSSSKHVIYCVGVDGLDDGGAGNDMGLKLLADPPAPATKSSGSKRKRKYKRSDDSE